MSRLASLGIQGLSLGLGQARQAAGPVLPMLDGLSNVTSAFSAFRQLDTDYVGSFYTASGGLVSAFLDQSGNSRNLAQATGANKPAVGTNALTFDGARFMSGSNLTALIANNNAFMVVSFSATTVNRGAASQQGMQVVGDAAEGGDIILKNSITSPRGMTAVQFDGAYKETPGTYVPLATPVVASLRKDGTKLYARVNLLTEQEIVCGNLTALAFAIYLGGNGANRFIGDIMEFVTFNVAPSLATREAIIENMMDAVSSPTPPSLAGFPSALTTGTTGVLTPVTGNITLSTPGQTYENIELTGGITITANNVTVRNCKIIGNDTSGIEVSTGASGATISHCEIDCGTVTANGVYLEPGTADCLVEYCNIYDMENGINLLGSGHTIQHNYVHDFNLSTGTPHYDGIEMNGNLSDTLVTHNTVINLQDQTSAVMINNSFGAVDSLIVSNNYLAGGAFTIYYDAQFSVINLLTNVTIEDNVMGSGVSDYININANGGASPTTSNNVRYDSGFAIS